jgi:hypothetical protein
MRPTIWGALIPAIQSSLQVKVRMTLAYGERTNKFLLQDMHTNTGWLSQYQSGMYCRIYEPFNDGSPLLWFYLFIINGQFGNTSNQYFNFQMPLTVPNLYDVEHEWRFEHTNLTGDPNGYAEAQIYCDGVLIGGQKFNNTNVGAMQKQIGFNQGYGNSNRYGLFLGNYGSKLSFITINRKP